MENPLQSKKSFAEKLETSQLMKDPRKGSLTALGCSLVSFLILGRPLATVGIVFGVLGIYVCSRKKAGTLPMLLNVAAVVLGLVSYYLLVRFVR